MDYASCDLNAKNSLGVVIIKVISITSITCLFIINTTKCCPKGLVMTRLLPQVCPLIFLGLHVSIALCAPTMHITKIYFATI